MTWAEAIEVMKSDRRVRRKNWWRGLAIGLDLDGNIELSNEYKEWLHKGRSSLAVMDAYEDAIANDWEIVE
jgi:hypothetical protein